MFGLEFQVSRNVFTKGVLDREVAWRHPSGVTLEGDETTAAGGLSELEFVTPPCAKLPAGQEAARVAAALARALADRAGQPNAAVDFRSGQTLAGGTWERDCTIGFGDLGFSANPQGTVGVGLSAFRDFVTAVLAGEPDGKMLTEDLDLVRSIMRNDHKFDLAGAGPELDGFLTACHLFLLRATWSYARARAIGDNGIPLELGDKSATMWRVFTFKSDYLAKIRHEEKPHGMVPSFLKSNGLCQVLVNRDSPKSAFALLPRTDFRSMYLALPGHAREHLAALGPPPAAWPPAWTGQQIMFQFPYRADPADDSGLAVKYPAGGWPNDGIGTKEDWSLVEHGPTVAEWWNSICNGRLYGQSSVKKDLASPPPGIRGRDPAKLAVFPGKDEDKRAYYGMGAYPMDTSDHRMSLAVYELRSFSTQPDLVALMPLTFDKWEAAVTVFHRKFVLN